MAESRSRCSAGKYVRYGSRGVHKPASNNDLAADGSLGSPLVQRRRYNVKGKPPRVTPSNRSLPAKILLTLAAIGVPFLLDLVTASRRAQVVGALLANGHAPNVAILAVGRYAMTVDAPPGCQTPSPEDSCPEVL